MELKLGNKSLWIIIISWVFILGYVSNAVISAEYYTAHIYEYDDGGQIVNVTMLNGEYVYIYYTTIPEEGYGTGITPHKLEIGDIFVRYNVKDGIEIPIIYTPREWQETILNNEVKDTNENHLPLNILIGLFISQITIIGIGLLNHARKSINS